VPLLLGLCVLLSSGGSSFGRASRGHRTCNTDEAARARVGDAARFFGRPTRRAVGGPGKPTALEQQTDGFLFASSLREASLFASAAGRKVSRKNQRQRSARQGGVAKRDVSLAAAMESEEFRNARQAPPAIPVVTIPVVFHVLYNTAPQNLALSQLQSQIDVLNEDFNSLNSDLSLAAAAFRPVISGGVSFNFTLHAVTRTPTATAAFDINTDDIKVTASGGKDGWDTTRYLNIWTGNLGSGLLGYATFPGWTPATHDGVVLLWNSVGRGGSAVSPFNLGRTGTHEVGHWFALNHVWGFWETTTLSCADDDAIWDTPRTDTEHYGCPSLATLSCSNTANVQNFLDYVDDRCMVMFTRGQADLMSGMLRDALGPRRRLAVPSCGDGVLQDGSGLGMAEECDDSNSVADDGCTGCAVDLGYSCSGQPSSCITEPTQCDSWSEDFEATAIGALPSGWTAVQLNNGPARTYWSVQLSGDAVAQRVLTLAPARKIHVQVKSPVLDIPQLAAGQRGTWVGLGAKLRLLTEAGSAFACYDALRVAFEPDGQASLLELDAENVPYWYVSGVDSNQLALATPNVSHGWCSPLFPTFTEVRFDISAYAGRRGRFVFEWAQDSGIHGTSAEIDALRLFHTGCVAVPTTTAIATTTTGATTAPAPSTTTTAPITTAPGTTTSITQVTTTSLVTTTAQVTTTAPATTASGAVGTTSSSNAISTGVSTTGAVALPQRSSGVSTSVLTPTVIGILSAVCLFVCFVVVAFALRGKKKEEEHSESLELSSESWTDTV
jgi:cysteine-rich repeat protein